MPAAMAEAPRTEIIAPPAAQFDQPATNPVVETASEIVEDPAPAASTTSEPDVIAEAEPEVAPATEAPARPEPHLATKNDAFMPPPPIDPKSTAKPTIESASDAFKAADLVNGGAKDDMRRRGPNLFQRITGTTRERRPDAPERTMPVEPALERPVARPYPEERQETTPQQARLDGVDPEDGVKTSQSDDDLLEIPAFLRRQAN